MILIRHVLRKSRPKDGDDVGDVSLLESIFSLEGTQSGIRSRSLQISLGHHSSI